jgi:hypothetical protein
MQSDLGMALFNGYLALVRVLHRSGAINAADLTNELGNTIDFRRKEKTEPPEAHELLETLYKAVAQLERQEAQLAEMKALHQTRLAELQAQIDAARRGEPPPAA